MPKNNPTKIYYPRDLSKKIEPYLTRREAIAIKGPRQAGKTTLLKTLFKKLKTNKRCLYLTFEKRTDLEIFENDLENFKKIYIDNHDVVFIDEFQYAHNGGQKLKYLYDTGKTKLIISGSSSLELTSKTGKYMVGRLVSFHLYPFSFSEYLHARSKKLARIIDNNHRKLHKLLKFESTVFSKKPSLVSQSLQDQLNNYLEEYLLYGGYPAVTLEKNPDIKQELLKNILEAYLLYDIKSIFELSNHDQLVKLAKLLSLQIGNIVVYSELCNTINITFENLKRYLQILTQTFLIQTSQPFYTNKRLEITKNPRIFFIDPGFRNLLINNFTALSSRTDTGALFENFVFTQLLRITNSLEGVKFWRTKSQAEVDVILEKAGQVLPIEVKFHASPSVGIGRSFHSFINKYQPRVGLVITKNYFGYHQANSCHIYFIPGYYL